MQAVALGKPAVVAWDILFVDPAAGNDGVKADGLVVRLCAGMGSSASLCARVYLEIVRRYQIAPPDETQEGEYVMTLK